VQLRDPSPLTSEAYVAQCAWQYATLACCPRHPGGGCGFARHGTYVRKTPAGLRIARYYCPTAQETFSLLPDCLASRFPGDLADLERVARTVETARSIEAAADVLRPEIVLPSAIRWVRRRLTLVRATLLAVVTLLPDLCGTDAHVGAVRTALGSDQVLVTLRGAPRRCCPRCRVRSDSPLRVARRGRAGHGPNTIWGLTGPRRRAEDRACPRHAGRRDTCLMPVSCSYRSRRPRRRSPCFATA
jgi:hypothetical protein